MLHRCNNSCKTSVPIDPAVDLRHRENEDRNQRLMDVQTVRGQRDHTGHEKRGAGGSQTWFCSFKGRWVPIRCTMRYLMNARTMEIVSERGKGLSIQVHTNAKYVCNNGGRLPLTKSALLRGRSVIPWICTTQRYVTFPLQKPDTSL